MNNEYECRYCFDIMSKKAARKKRQAKQNTQELCPDLSGLSDKFGSKTHFDGFVKMLMNGAVKILTK